MHSCTDARIYPVEPTAMDRKLYCLLMLYVITAICLQSRRVRCQCMEVTLKCTDSQSEILFIYDIILGQLTLNLFLN